MTDWSRSLFGDIAEVLPGRYLPATDYDPSGPYVIYGSNSIMGRSAIALYPGPLIAFARIGSNCGATMYSAEACWINNNAAGIRGRRGTDTQFLYYWMQNFDFTQIREGSGQPYISDRTLKAQVVDLPPFREQCAIAEILGTLDDKIDMNRRMSETLEAIARALFKSWFVDFDPVRAKAEGRDPGLPRPIADVFPSRFKNSELGEIPEAWSLSVVGDLAEVQSGRRPGSRIDAQPAAGSVPLWGGNGRMGYVPAPLVDYPIILTGRVGTLGSLFRVTSPCWPSDNTLFLRPHRQQLFEYLFLSVELVDLPGLNRGSTQPLITQGDLKAQLLVVPNHEVINLFHDVVRRLYVRVDAATEESDTVGMLRDSLLPKLISGELRVPQAKRLLEAAPA
ncbi:MAG TPA: restriction endonuclease subunit S [Gemmatimonadaceae bacterium]|nr:restriction endonuclease subunit S [Gemmatimonadaceae bacterium]